MTHIWCRNRCMRVDKRRCCSWKECSPHAGCCPTWPGVQHSAVMHARLSVAQVVRQVQAFLEKLLRFSCFSERGRCFSVWLARLRKHAQLLWRHREFVGKWCCFVSAGWQDSFHGRSCQQWQGHCMSSLAGVHGGHSSCLVSGESAPAAAAFLYSTLRPAWLLSWPGLPASSHQLPANFHASGPTLILSVSLGLCWNVIFVQRSYGITCVCMPAQTFSLDKVITASSGQQERIYGKASTAHAIINSVFPIRLCAFWFGLSLTPVTAGCAFCWLVGGIQGWEHVPILSRVSALCSALTAGSSCQVQPALTLPASQQQEGKCSGKCLVVVMADFSLTSAFEINNLQAHPFSPSGHFTKQCEQPWEKHSKF